LGVEREKVIEYRNGSGEDRRMNVSVKCEREMKQELQSERNAVDK
jgi:hypothetical protein